MLDRSAVGQLSSLSSRTKWQRLSTGDTLCIWQQFPYYQCYLIYYWPTKIYLDQNLQLHFINTFNSQIQPTTSILNTTSRDLELMDRHYKWIHKQWPGPLANSCPTADRSRKMAQKHGPVSCWTRSGFPLNFKNEISKLFPDLPWLCCKTLPDRLGCDDCIFM